MDIEQLNSDYGIEGQLKFIKGSGGFPFIQICNRSATALISVYAAQVLSYRPTEEDEDLLFLSSKSYYDDGKAIRGGIPVCWPWFGDNAVGLDRPSHGFVRNGLWTVAGTEATTAFETKVRLKFPENAHNDHCWQQAFDLELEISVGDSLTLDLMTRNTGEQSFSITQAFHTYLRIGNIGQVRIIGLEGAVYTDKLDDDRQKRQTGTLTVWEEVDRIYMNVQNELIVVDAAFKRRIKITAADSKSAVVWNPWTKKSAVLPDLDDGDFRHFICVETGNIAGNVVELPPDGVCRLLTNFEIIRD